MEKDNSINLLSPESKVSERLTLSVASLRRVSLVSLVLLVVSVLLVGVTYLLLHQRYVSLSVRRDALRSRVAADLEKEAELVALRGRAQLVDKLLASQMDWAPLVARVSEIAPVPHLASIVVDEKHRVVVTVKTDTVEDNFPILAAIVADVEAKKIVSPEITSFQLNKDGVANLVVAFFTVLSL